jgi:hypothetical protein
MTDVTNGGDSTTESGEAATAPTAPSDGTTINPDVVAQSATSGPAGEDVAPPPKLSLLDRVRALEVRVLGRTDPGDDGTDDD